MLQSYINSIICTSHFSIILFLNYFLDIISQKFYNLSYAVDELEKKRL